MCEPPDSGGYNISRFGSIPLPHEVPHSGVPNVATAYVDYSAIRGGERHIQRSFCSTDAAHEHCTAMIADSDVPAYSRNLYLNGNAKQVRCFTFRFLTCSEILATPITSSPVVEYLKVYEVTDRPLVLPDPTLGRRIQLPTY